MIIIFILTFFSIYSISLKAGVDEELFLSASHHYKNKEWEKALEDYTKMTEKGPAVWYNMGNCCYYMNNNFDAFVYWRRTQKYSHNVLYSLAEKNIALLQPVIEKNNISKIKKMLSTPFFAVPLFIYQSMLIILWYALYMVFKKYWLKTFLKIILIILSFLTIGLIIHMSVLYLNSQTCFAIVQQDCSVHTGPDTTYQIIDTLNKQNEIIIQSSDPLWYKIVYNQKSGWVLKENIITL